MFNEFGTLTWGESQGPDFAFTHQGVHAARICDLTCRSVALAWFTQDHAQGDKQV